MDWKNIYWINDYIAQCVTVGTFILKVFKFISSHIFLMGLKALSTKGEKLHEVHIFTNGNFTCVYHCLSI